MYLRTLLIVFVVAVLGLFTALNWQAITAPARLSLIFTTMEAPLGVILLGALVLLAALFLFYVVYLQSSVLLETRRHTRELHAQRELAEQAERSRFHELRTFLESQIETLAQNGERSQAELLARLEALERNTRAAISQSENSVAAYMAELDDRLRRAANAQPQKPA
jgi:uncharacterized integral membrane protein